MIRLIIETACTGSVRWRRCDEIEFAFRRNVPITDWVNQKREPTMPTVNNSDLFSNITNTSVLFGGTGDRLTFIGSSSCRVTASGLNQTVSLINDSWMVVQSQSPGMLNVQIQGNDSNITINDMTHNMHIILDHQGPYTITNNTG